MKGAKAAMIKDIVEKLPFWERLSPEQKTLVAERSSLRSFEANQVIVNTDNTCTGIVFIEHGGIRASLLSEEGREVKVWEFGETAPTNRGSPYWATPHS